MIPFSVYDFFGYLACGFVLCGTADLVIGNHWLLRSDLPIAHAVAWTITAYVLGHIVAHLSSWLFEDRLVRERLGLPSTVLFSPAPKRTVFPGYYTPLDEELQERVRERARAQGVGAPGEVLFHHARSLAKADERTWANLEQFLALYGFARNMSLALLLTAISLTLVGVCRGATAYLLYAPIALIAAIGMLYRYLKFYRQYSYEIFTAYPDLAQKGGSP